MKALLPAIIVLALAACASSPDPKPLPEPIEDARALHELALEAFNAGRYRQAIAAFHRAERQFLGIDDPRGIAVSAISQAEIRLLLGENDEAGKSLQRAQTPIDRTGSEQLRDRARLIEARLAVPSDPQAAHRAFNALIADAAPAIAAQARLALCEMEVRHGETRCAASLAADDPLTNARIAHLGSRASMQDGELDAARAKLGRAWGLYHALAFRPGVAAVHESGAQLALMNGETKRAQEHFERALYLRLWIRDRVHAAGILAKLAEISEGSARRRYRAWQETLLDESAEPEWDAMLDSLVKPR